MKYLQYTYLLYGILGIFSGLTGIFTNTQSTTELFATGNTLFAEYAIYSQGFSNAIFTIALVAVATFFIKDVFAKKYLTLILALFNFGAAYLCLTIQNIPQEFYFAGFMHIFLAIVYAVMGLFLIKTQK